MTANLIALCMFVSSGRPLSLQSIKIRMQCGRLHAASCRARQTSQATLLL
jgi:hypothetical protein